MSTVYGTLKPILAKVIRRVAAKPQFQQFGQANDDWVWNGATACTHTIVQTLYYIWFGKVLTLNQINAAAGMPHNARNSKGQPRGMNNAELTRAFQTLKLPYVVKWGLAFETLISYSNRGPVFYGMRYGSAPTQKGFVYQGITAKAPFARKHGRTQLKGFEDGRHAVLMLGYRAMKDAETGRTVFYIAYRKEPNHGSSARPEKPPYDEITTAQAKREYLDYRDKLGNTLYAAIPTRSLPL